MPPTSLSRRAAWAGVSLLVAAVAGQLYPGHRVVVHQTLGHPFVFVTVAFLLFAVAAGAVPRGAGDLGLLRRATVVLGALSLGAFTAAFGYLFSTEGGWHTTQRLAAPGGRPYRMVLAEGSSIDTYWVVRVETTRGALRQRWDAACLSDDAPEQGLAAVRWVGPDRLLVTTEDDGAFTVAVARTGRPLPAGVPPPYRC